MPNVAVVDMKGNYDEITGGDTIEEDPRWSKTDNRIFCSTAGYARDEREFIAAVSPRAIMAIDVKNNKKIIAICANNKNGIVDLGCQNKMYWLGDFDGYYLTVDDDNATGERIGGIGSTDG